MYYETEIGNGRTAYINKFLFFIRYVKLLKINSNKHFNRETARLFVVLELDSMSLVEIWSRQSK